MRENNVRKYRTKILLGKQEIEENQAAAEDRQTANSGCEDREN